MNVLVVGGAGYIGSHMIRHLDQAGHQPIVYDNLSTGFRQAVTVGELVEGDLHDQEKLESTIQSFNVDAVMHFAASALVGESVENPEKYYQNNVVAACKLLQSMRRTGVSRLVFSSTCAIYGEPETIPISEAESQKPVNPYGFTKLVIERALEDYARAYGLGFAALRYFNASGASADGMIGEDHDPESHLIPLVLQVALGQRDSITIFGDDYPTADGTCIRDYIHVDDLCVAHLRALEKLADGTMIRLNLGTGIGHSVREVIEVCREVTGCSIPSTIGKRRPGDPPELVADSSQAARQLDWRPQHIDLKSIIESAWKWHQHHPRGYRQPAAG